MSRISSIIERLREKPKEVRVQVSFLSALCVTGVIGLLWGVTLPLRLNGLPHGDETAQAQSENDLNAFFASTKNNLGQLIGAAGGGAPDDAPEERIDNAPKSDAYRAGAPSVEPAGYYDNPFETKKPVVTPVDRREVRIGTTTSKTKNQPN